MRIELCPDGPVDLDATLARYRIWGEDPANRLVGDAFYRVLPVDGRLHGYELRWSGSVDAPRLAITIPGSRSSRVAEAVTGEVSRLLFLDADLAGFYRIAKSDRILRELIPPLYGMRPTLAPTPFEMLVGAITAQQVNLAMLSNGEVVAALTRVRGLGLWTAEWFLARALGRGDVWRRRVKTGGGT